MDTFKFSQGSDSTVRFAHIAVPGCGRNKKDDAPVVSVEIEGDKITLLVYADILAEQPTHEIPLGGAKLTVKQKVANG